MSEQQALLLSDVQDEQNSIPLASTSSFLRLFVTWLAAIICGGITPGAVIFNDLFAEAGMYEGTCKVDGSIPCKEQYLAISGVLQGLGGLIYLAMLPGGMVLDSVGARTCGIVGALTLSVGVMILAVATAMRGDILFVLAVVIVDMGSLVNNFAFYGFLWHLPGWQALIVALSNGSIQVAALLPLLLKLAMQSFKLSLPIALLCYAVVGCGSAGLCWFAVPSQAEFYQQAKRVLGIPVPRPLGVQWRQFREAVLSGHSIMKTSRESFWMVLVIGVGQLSMSAYSSQAVPFGQELFHSKADGERLGDMYAKVTACVGALGTSLIGTMVDCLGLQALALGNILSILLILFLLDIPTWNAQVTCISCSAFYMNSFVLYLLRWMAFIAPPHRFGILQGLGVVYMFGSLIPMSIGMVVWMGSFDDAAGIERYVIPMRSAGVAGVIGWSFISVRLFRMPLPEMVLSASDEKELMQRFRLQSLADAEIVLALPHKEILQRFASDDVSEQRKLLELATSAGFQERYWKLARARAEEMPAAECQPKEVTVEVGPAMWVNSSDPKVLIPALVSSWDGDVSTRGEPLKSSVLQHLQHSDPLRRKVLENIVGFGVVAGHHFGYALALQNEAMEVLGVCICYPPGSLENQEPVTQGGQRSFFLHARYEKQAWADVGIWRQLPSAGLEQAKGLKLLNVSQHHPENPHWYIHMLGIVPGHRAKGLSKLLLTPVFEWARKDSLPCYLECATENVPIYSKLGFNKVWSDEMAGLSVQVHGMLRPPGV